MFSYLRSGDAISAEGANFAADLSKSILVATLHSLGCLPLAGMMGDDVFRLLFETVLKIESHVAGRQCFPSL